MFHKPICRRLNQTIEKENCEVLSVSRADSPSFAASDFDALNMVETNDCHLRIYFRDNQMGCRCVIDREHNCQVIINRRWQRRIRSMDVIGHCRWEIAGYVKVNLSVTSTVVTTITGKNYLSGEVCSVKMPEILTEQ